MAESHPRKNTAVTSLGGLTKSQALVVALEAAASLGWAIQYKSENGLIAHTDNGMMAWNGIVTVRITEDEVSATSASADGRLIDLGKNKRTAAQFITALEEQRQRISDEELDSRYAALAEELPANENDPLLEPPPTTREKITGFFSLFKPSAGYTITPIILDLNILIFIAMAATGVGVFEPDTSALLDWGANFRPLTLGGEWWRMITCNFIHIGLFHLLLNSYALVIIGAQLEPLMGKARFLAAYLITGLGASIVSLWWHDLTVSAGASGAIFGLYGVFLAMLTTNLIEKTVRKQLLGSILVFVVYNLMFGMKGGIDNAAHIGGLLSGLVVGYAFYPTLKRHDAQRTTTLTIGALSVLFLAVAVFALRSIPNDIGMHDQKMELFSTNDQTVVSVLNMTNTTSPEKLKELLETTGIPSAEKNITIMKEIESLNLPDVVKQRDGLIKSYAEVRLKTLELLHQNITDSAGGFQMQIDASLQQADSLLKELNAER